MTGIVPSEAGAIAAGDGDGGSRVDGERAADQGVSAVAAGEFQRAAGDGGAAGVGFDAGEDELARAGFFHADGAAEMAAMVAVRPLATLMAGMAEESSVRVLAPASV